MAVSLLLHLKRFWSPHRPWILLSHPIFHLWSSTSVSALRKLHQGCLWVHSLPPMAVSWACWQPILVFSFSIDFSSRVLPLFVKLPFEHKPWRYFYLFGESHRVLRRAFFLTEAAMAYRNSIQKRSLCLMKDLLCKGLASLAFLWDLWDFGWL